MQFCNVLLDTSAIVAIFQPNERHHEACKRTLATIAAPLLTTWPVLTEAHYLLRRDRQAQVKLLALAQSDAVSL